MRAAGRWFLALGAAAALAASPALAQQPARRIIPLVRVRATLQTTLDAKKAKPGEPVRARLDENVPIPNGPTIPKSTILEGRVDQVVASEHHSNSSLVITFDHARLRTGEVMPVKVTVLTVTETVQSATAGVNSSANSAEAPAPEGTTPSARPANFPPQPGTVANPAAPDFREPQSPQNQTPAPQPSSRDIPGVTLRSDVDQSTSATFLSPRRNVYVPGGAQMEIAVGVMPKKGTISPQ